MSAPSGCQWAHTRSGTVESALAGQSDVHRHLGFRRLLRQTRPDDATPTQTPRPGYSDFVNRNCSDFATQAQAQALFDSQVRAIPTVSMATATAARARACPEGGSGSRPPRVGDGAGRNGRGAGRLLASRMVGSVGGAIDSHPTPHGSGPVGRVGERSWSLSSGPGLAGTTPLSPKRLHSDRPDDADALLVVASSRRARPRAGAYPQRTVRSARVPAREAVDLAGEVRRIHEGVAVALCTRRRFVTSDLLARDRVRAVPGGKRR